MNEKIQMIKGSNLPRNLIFDFSYMAHRAKYHKDISDQGFKNNINLWKHIVLSGLFKGIQIFKPENVQIMCDSKTWRSDDFPEYKWKRKQKRKESGEDFTEFFEEINKFELEIKNNFPYHVFKIEKCEADDIIAVFCNKNSKDCINILISSDKDFGQLNQFSNFFQFCPIAETLLESPEWKYELFKMCVKGDTSDGIPNFLMQDDCFVKGIRQKAIRETNIKEWYAVVTKEGKSFCENDLQQKRFIRNCKLIRFDYIPKDIKENIKKVIDDSSIIGNRQKMLNYFMAKDMLVLQEKLEGGKI